MAKKKPIRFKQSFVDNLSAKDVPKGTPYLELYDARNPGLSLRVGKRSKTYYSTISKKREKLGSTDEISYSQAEKRHNDILDLQDKDDRHFSKYPLGKYIQEVYSSDTKVKSKINLQHPIFNIPISKLKIIDIENWDRDRRLANRQRAIVKNGVKTLKDTGTKVSISTVKREYNVIRAALNHALKSEYLTKNVSSPVKISGNDEVSRNPIPEHDFRMYVKAIALSDNKLLKLFLQIMMNTGARTQEVLTIKRRNICYDSNEIVVPAAFSKTNSTRYLPISDELRDILVDHFKDEDSSYAKNSENPEDWLFFNPKTKTHYKSFRKAYETLIRKNRLRYYSLYHFRHSLASGLVNDGVDLITVKEILGHKDIKTTQIYTKSLKKIKKAAVDSYSTSIAYKPAVWERELILQLIEDGHAGASKNNDTYMAWIERDSLIAKAWTKADDNFDPWEHWDEIDAEYRREINNFD